MMTKINTELADSLLSNFGVSEEDVEIVSEKRYEITNGISDGEIASLAGPYGKAILERMKDAAFFFNANLVASQITLPWRELLDAFREDLEQTSSLQTLILPDGSEQIVLVDSGKYPGDPQLRKALWHLHEILEEIENYKATDHINSHVAKAFGQQGGRPAAHDDETILSLIVKVARSNSGKEQMKGSEIYRLVQDELYRLKMPNLGKTKFYDLLKIAEQEP